MFQVEVDSKSIIIEIMITIDSKKAAKPVTAILQKGEFSIIPNVVDTVIRIVYMKTAM